MKTVLMIAALTFVFGLGVPVTNATVMCDQCVASAALCVSTCDDVGNTDASLICALVQGDCSENPPGNACLFAKAMADSYLGDCKAQSPPPDQTTTKNQ